MNVAHSDLNSKNSLYWLLCEFSPWSLETCSWHKKTHKNLSIMMITLWLADWNWIRWIVCYLLARHARQIIESRKINSCDTWLCHPKRGNDDNFCSRCVRLFVFVCVCAMNKNLFRFIWLIACYFRVHWYKNSYVVTHFERIFNVSWLAYGSWKSLDRIWCKPV